MERGYSYWQIRQRLKDGRLKQVLAHVFVEGTATITFELVDQAAFVACGQPVIMSGPSAARLWRLEAPLGKPCLTIPPERNRRLQDVYLLREHVPHHDLCNVQGYPTTSKAKTVVDTLRLLPQESRAAFLDRALQKRWIAVDELEERVAQLSGYRGVRVLRELIRDARAGAHSQAERMLVNALLENGITGFVPNYVLHDERGKVRAIVDVAFPDIFLALEVDGWAWHSDRARFQRDRTRQNALTTLGWTVLRFTWDDVANRINETVNVIRRALARLGNSKDAARRRRTQVR